MSRRRLIFIGIPVVLLIGAGAAVWFARPRPVVVTIDVSGTSGLPIQANCEVDGNPRELTGVVPTQFVLEGSQVTFSLATAADSGEFRLKAAAGQQVFGSSGSGTPPKNAVRGWAKSRWFWMSPTHWIEPFARDEQQNWLNPPP